MKTFRNVVGSKVHFDLSADSPCPCGSGNPAAACHLTEAGFRMDESCTTPEGTKTGKSLKKCYASRLDDCGQKLTREHYISASLLHYLNQDEELTVSGLPWLENKSKIISPKSLTSKILCNRHNHALSPLDRTAERLFQAFDKQGEGILGSGQPLLHLFSGHDLERWILKILCGIACSRNLIIDSGVDVSIPDYWLNILFCGAQFPDGQGLYVCKSIGHEFEVSRRLALRTIVNKRGRLTGIGVWVCGYELVLSMSGFASRLFDGREFVYRPLELYSTGQGFEKSIMLSWNGNADLGTVSYGIPGT